MEIPGLLLSVESVGTLLRSRAERKHSALRGVPASGAMDASVNVCSLPKLPYLQRKPSILYFLQILQVLITSGYFWPFYCYELSAHDCIVEKTELRQVVTLRIS